MDIYKFPFSTCELKKNDSQSTSALVNILCVLIVLSFILFIKPHNTKVYSLWFVIVLFELWHAYSHYKHISNSVQMYVIHLLTYIITFTTLYVINSPWTLYQLIPIITIIIIDILMLLNKKHAISVITGVAVFVIACIVNLDYFPHAIKEIYLLLSGLIVLGIIMFINEIYNCKAMLQYYHAPHILVEMVVVIFLSLFAYNMK